MAGRVAAMRRLFCGNSRFFSTTAREAYLKKLSEEATHAKSTAALWKKISIFVALPSIALVGYNAYQAEVEHMSHGRPEFVAYEHLRLRKVRFPWGDGNHSLFHGHNNPLPDGYED